MNNGNRYSLAIAATFLWIGFVGAISFMEAWLKFRAPGISLELGLGIGRIVFNALNKVEWVMAILIFTSLLRNKIDITKPKNTLVLIPTLILILQTFWLLPTLDARAELHIQNLPVPPSKMHFVYIGVELVKVIFLFAFGIQLLRNKLSTNIKI